MAFSKSVSSGVDGHISVVSERGVAGVTEIKVTTLNTTPHCSIGHVHYRDGRDSRFADAGGIAERVAFCRYN